MSRLVLDAGAFVAFERGERVVRGYLQAARRLAIDVATSSPVVAQVWRDGRRQSLLARLLAGVRIIAPDELAARRAGALLARTKTSDVVDALVAGLLRPADTVLTSEPRDLERLLEAAGVEAVIVAV